MGALQEQKPNTTVSYNPKDDKDYGNLIVGFSELADLSDQIPKDEKINIVMMHHGVEWLQADDGRRFQHWLVQNNVKMVFCGHNHAPGMNILTEAISENRLPIITFILGIIKENEVLCLPCIVTRINLPCIGVSGITLILHGRIQAQTFLLLCQIAVVLFWTDLR